MKINEALDLKEVKKVIEALKNEKKTEFSSHDFIKKYAWNHEEKYVEMLYEHKTNEPFRTVHAKIALFLAQHTEELKIKKITRKESMNIFGHETEVQFWIHSL